MFKINYVGELNTLPEALPTFQTGGQGDAAIVIYLLTPECVSFSSGKPCVTGAERHAERTHNTPRVEPAKGCVACIHRLQLTPEHRIELIRHVDNDSSSVNTDSFQGDAPRTLMA